MGDRLFLARADLFGVVANLISSCHEKAAGDEPSVALTQEGVDVGFGNVIILIVALGLNGPGLTIPVPENKIDTLVHSPFVGPFIPHPYLIDLG